MCVMFIERDGKSNIKLFKLYFIMVHIVSFENCIINLYCFNCVIIFEYISNIFCSYSCFFL